MRKLLVISAWLVIGFLIFGYCIEEAEASFFEEVNKAVIMSINKIVSIFGQGPIGKPPNTHFACVKGGCVLIDSAGADDCLKDAHCFNVNTCNDKTPFGSCVGDGSEKYCDGDTGMITDKCSVCGCASGYVCGSDDKCVFVGGSGNGSDGSGGSNNGLDDSSLGCIGEEQRSCGSDTGECVSGIETCVGGNWGVCAGEVRSSSEVCDDGKDNDCDGDVDEGCGGGTEGDVDDDGLNDDWEMQYFGNLYYGWDDDVDNDGIINGEEFSGGTDPTISDIEGRGGIVYIGAGIGAVIVIVVLILVIGRIAKKRKKKSQAGVEGGEGVKSGRGDESSDVGGEVRKIKAGLSEEKRAQIENYIKKARVNGFNDKQIKSSLLKVGWKEEQIEEFF